MKAVVLTRYGPPGDLTLREWAMPTPRPDEVLVRVRAAAVNDWDWCYVRGRPLPYRLIFGLFRPKVAILGAELSGTIEAVGAAVPQFKPGDAVYGDVSDAGFGAFAEFVAVRADALRAKPHGISFEEAAALPHAAVLAWQGLVDLGKIRHAETILINGAGGGVGTLGVQIAKTFGATVTGVDSTAKLESMRAVGFDHVIDYTREDFTRAGRRYDLILDTKTNRSPWRYLHALKDGGRYVTVGGQPHRLLQFFLWAPVLAKISGKRLRILALKPNQGLERITELVGAKRLRCVIDSTYSLADLPSALERFGEAKHFGKVVIRI